MVNIEMLQRIRDLKKKGYKKARAAREIGIDAKTVKKYWNMTDDDYIEYYEETQERTKMMNPYKDFVAQKLEQYPEITSAIIYDNLCEAFDDFEPSARSVRRYVATLREELGIPSGLKVRQYEEVAELPFGFQAQVDMGQKTMKDQYGKYVKVYIFAMVMSNSRQKFTYFQSHPFTAGEFIVAHDLAFKYFGGRTAEIVYDQDRVMIVSENSGDIIYTEVFERYRNYVGFTVRLCRGSDPESKGKIESVIKYIKHNFLSCRIYQGESRLNSDGLAWLERTANGTIHETTKMIPKVVFREEQKHLKPAPTLSSASTHTSTTAMVRKTNVVNFRQNRYAMPKGTYAPGKKVKIEIDEKNNSVSFYHLETNELIRTYEIAIGVGRYIKDKHGSRDRSKYTELKEKVFHGFADIPNAHVFIEKIIQAKERYTRDQLSILNKCKESYSDEELAHAVNYCMEKTLFSAVDFNDTLEYFSKKSEPEPAIAAIVLPIKYQVVRAKKRDLVAYSSIYEGRCD